MNASTEIGKGVNPGSGTYAVLIPSDGNEFAKDLPKKVTLKAGEILLRLESEPGIL